MAKTKKRILSLAMVLVMVFTLLPVSALAEGETEDGGVVECTREQDCPAETHVEGCPKYVAPDENNDEDLNKDPEDQNAEVPEAVQAVENLIKALPEYADVGPDDLSDIEAADRAYQALSPEEKAAVAPDLAKLLTDLVDLAEEIRQILEDDTETPDRVTYEDYHTGWTALTKDGGSLTAEKYYLTDNVTLETNLTIPANTEVTLDLNGFTLRGKGSGSVITVLGKLTLKDAVKAHLLELGHEVKDFGIYEAGEKCDYPEKAGEVARYLRDGNAERGILICGTGVGMSIAANKVKGIRACCCSDTFSARMTRAHNDANILTFGERVVGQGLAMELVDAFLTTEFEGGRHQRRVDLIAKLEAEE